MSADRDAVEVTQEEETPQSLANGADGSGSTISPPLTQEAYTFLTETISGFNEEQMSSFLASFNSQGGKTLFSQSGMSLSLTTSQVLAFIQTSGSQPLTDLHNVSGVSDMLRTDRTSSQGSITATIPSQEGVQHDDPGEGGPEEDQSLVLNETVEEPRAKRVKLNDSIQTEGGKGKTLRIRHRSSKNPAEIASSSNTQTNNPFPTPIISPAPPKVNPLPELNATTPRETRIVIPQVALTAAVAASPSIQIPVADSTIAITSRIKASATLGDPSDLFRVFMHPEGKTSKNLDYVSGTKEPKTDEHYYTYCRDGWSVPFDIRVNPNCKTAAKVLIRVICYLENEIAVIQRCANHKDKDRDSPYRAHMVTAPETSRVEYLEDSEGKAEGLRVKPVPSRIVLVFHCRNYCQHKQSKDFRLEFALLDGKNNLLASRETILKVAQVPLRDIVREDVKYEVVPHKENFFTFRRFSDDWLDSAKKNVKRESTETKPETPPPPSQLHTIHVYGDDAYRRVMACVKLEEDRRRDRATWTEDIVGWTRNTPIKELLTLVCSTSERADSMLKLFQQAKIKTLGAMADRFNAQLLHSIGIPPPIASSISSIFLNWYNTLLFNELPTAPH